MRVAFVGLGKLGLPVATTFASRGNKVYGYDSVKSKMDSYKTGISQLYEPGLDDLLREQLENRSLILCDSLESAVEHAEIIFVAVPTPSLPDYSFDTSHVNFALGELASVLQRDHKYRVVALISTVLPGTCRNEFIPILESKLGPAGEGWGFCYNAQFIAMGTVVENSLNPEFALIGEQDAHAGNLLEYFYTNTLPTQKPVLRMSLENAELTKNCYNTFISQKIVLANTVMELCDKIPNADCDVVSSALAKSTDRLISSKYMRGGLGDSGGCHPRDSRALSYLAHSVGLSADPFQFVTEARLLQSMWMTRKVNSAHLKTGLPVKILGITFKPDTNLTDDSCALLLAEQLKQLRVDSELYDPVALPESSHKDDGPRVYVIGTAWQQLKNYPFAPGSTIIDPHGLLDKAPRGCILDSVGRER